MKWFLGGQKGWTHKVPCSLLLSRRLARADDLAHCMRLRVDMCHHLCVRMHAHPACTCVTCMYHACMVMPRACTLHSNPATRRACSHALKCRMCMRCTVCHEPCTMLPCGASMLSCSTCAPVGNPVPVGALRGATASNGSRHIPEARGELRGAHGERVDCSAHWCHCALSGTFVVWFWRAPVRKIVWFRAALGTTSSRGIQCVTEAPREGLRVVHGKREDVSVH